MFKMLHQTPSINVTIYYLMELSGGFPFINYLECLGCLPETKLLTENRIETKFFVYKFFA